MKIYLLIAIVFITSFNVFSQTVKPTPPKLIEPVMGEPCSLKQSDLPTVRGLRLDMAKTQVQNEYPLMKMTTDPVKSSGIVFGYQIANPDYSNNINQITVLFRNDKVFSILFNYTEAVKWSSPKEFADKISESLKLPKARERNNAGGTFYSVTCNDFMVRTRINSNNQPTLLISRDPDEIWQTTKEKKDTFKP